MLSYFFCFLRRENVSFYIDLHYLKFPFQFTPVDFLSSIFRTALFSEDLSKIEIS